MIRLFWTGLCVVLLLSSCGYNGTPTRQNDFVPLTSIKIVAATPAIETSHTIAALTSTKLTVIGDYSGLFTRDITDQATFLSNSPTLANFVTAESPNRVTGIATGNATLTANVGSISATYTLTVSNATVTSLAVSPVAPSVPLGMTTQFTATGTFSDTTTQDLTFDATWASSPGTYAIISNSPASKGLATTSAIGDETITATFGSTPAIGTATLKVTAPVLQSITVTPANSSIAGFSKTVTFTATGTYSDGKTAAVSSTATWASSKTGIATISTAGEATTVAAGTTSISATLNGISGSTNLTVTALELKANGLQITPANPNVSVGSTQQLAVNATFTDGSTQNVAASSTWTSSATSRASVNSTGLITGNSAGTSIITAQYGGQSVSTTVTVQ